jgi:hypothetical protein
MGQKWWNVFRLILSIEVFSLHLEWVQFVENEGLSIARDRKWGGAIRTIRSIEWENRNFTMVSRAEKTGSMSDFSSRNWKPVFGMYSPIIWKLLMEDNKIKYAEKRLHAPLSLHTSCAHFLNVHKSTMNRIFKKFLRDCIQKMNSMIRGEIIACKVVEDNRDNVDEAV